MDAIVTACLEDILAGTGPFTVFAPNNEAFAKLSPERLKESCIDLKWMVQCHKDEYQNSGLRLEYTYLLFNRFIMNRIN